MLLRGFIFVGEVEVKCRFCKKVNNLGGVSGNLSNNHRYILMSDQNGIIAHSTASVFDRLGFTSEEILGTHVHEVLGFDPGYYKTLWKKLSKDHKKSILFQTIQYSKSGRPLVVQVGARVFMSFLGKELFLFDVETNPIRKTLPMAPIARKIIKVKKALA